MNKIKAVIIAGSVTLVAIAIITIVVIKSRSKSSGTLEETFQFAGNNGHPATVICPYEIVPTVIHFKTVNDYIVKCSNKTIQKDGKTEFEVGVELTYNGLLKKASKDVGNYMLYMKDGVLEVRPLNEFELREILAEYIYNS